MRYAKFQSTYMENTCFNGVCLTANCCYVWLPWVDDVVTDKDEWKSKITLQYSGCQIVSAFTKLWFHRSYCFCRQE